MTPTPSRRRGALYAFKVGEILLAWLAISVAGAVALEAPLTVDAILDAGTSATAFTVAALLAWHIILLTRGMYASHRLENGGRELLDVVGCACIMVASTAVIAEFSAKQFASPQFISVFLVALLALTTFARLVLRGFLRRLHARGRNIRNVLIVGAGDRALRLADTLGTRTDLGYRLVGCVDDLRPGGESALPWLGTLADLPKVLSHTIVDEVFIALPMRSGYQQIQEAVLRCEEQGTLVTLPTDFFAARLARTRMGNIDDQPVLYLSAVPENDWRIGVKQFIDFVGPLILIVLLSPVLLGVAIAVRCTSKGPVIFKQTRVGLNKRPFTLYKFRTMVQDAEVQQAALEHQNEASGPVFKIRNDPRITSIGSFLRKTSLDELPQLFNVLKGDMSLVGPRPLPNRDVDGFREDWQRRRFSVLPGITCLWQLSGRSNISFEQWMEMDLQYIDQWSLLLDLGILLKTTRAVIKREGAY